MFIRYPKDAHKTRKRLLFDFFSILKLVISVIYFVCVSSSIGLQAVHIVCQHDRIVYQVNGLHNASYFLIRTVRDSSWVARWVTQMFSPFEFTPNSPWILSEFTPSLHRIRSGELRVCSTNFVTLSARIRQKVLKPYSCCYDFEG